MPPTSEILDRLPPQNLEAEKAVLGSILLDGNVCDDVALILRSEGDFHSEGNRKLYAHLMGMHQAGKRIDAVLLVERLKKEGDFEAVGGAAYIAEVAQSVPYARNAEHYARIVRDKATMRQMILAATGMLQGAYNDTLDPEEVLTGAEKAVFGLRDSHDMSEPVDAAGLMLEAFSQLERASSDELPPGLPTGLVDVDQLLGGLRGGELIVLAARPGVGKSAMAGTIARHASLDQDVPTLMFSLEMSRLEIGLRLLSAEAKIDGHKMRTGFLGAQDHAALVPASAALSKAKLHIDDRAGLRASQMASVTRRMKRKHDVGLVIVDYLQLTGPEDKRVPRQEQVAESTRMLKALAREADVPVLCVAQLNRHAEDVPPRLSHLRESGAIEQDADVVLFLHRREMTLTSADATYERWKGVAEFIVGKNRNGRTGTVKLAWLEQHTRFENLAKQPAGWEVDAADDQEEGEQNRWW
jgi:replicative DNA helicase